VRGGRFFQKVFIREYNSKKIQKPFYPPSFLFSSKNFKGQWTSIYIYIYIYISACEKLESSTQLGMCTRQFNIAQLHNDALYFHDANKNELPTKSQESGDLDQWRAVQR
jgi:hypothetical protein